MIKNFIDEEKMRKALSLLERVLEVLEQYSGIVDIENKYPEDLMNILKQEKVFAMMVESEYGGLGLDYVSALYVLREFSRRIPALALSVFTHSQVLEYLKVSRHDLYEEIAKKVSRDGTILALAITEPIAGTDIKRIQTRVRGHGDGVVINGSKSVVTNGAYADFFLVLAKGEKGDFCAVLVKSDLGVGIDAVVDTIGMRGAGIARISFRDINVPREYLLEVGRDVIRNLFHILSLGRMFTASMALGVLDTALSEIFKWASTREVLDKKLIEYENVRQEVADIAAQAEILWTHLIGTAKRAEEGKDISYDAAILKFKSSELAKQAVDLASRLFGSHGYLRGTIIDRIYRDVKGLEFIEGANEALKAYVFKTLYKRFNKNANLLRVLGEDFE